MIFSPFYLHPLLMQIGGDSPCGPPPLAVLFWGSRGEAMVLSYVAIPIPLLPSERGVEAAFHQNSSF
jgi:hypothetical protein